MTNVYKILGVILVVSLAAGSAQAQMADKPFKIELLAGGAVPTFDITDLADPGFAAGAAFSYMISDKVLGIAEFDYGMHPGADDLPDVNVSHYMAKFGYQVFQSDDEKLSIYVNLGAGAMMFDADVEGAESNTYLAINAGAKLYYSVHDVISLVLSPQGDIAFVDEDEGFTNSTAWVWPFTAGIAVSF